MSSICFDLLYSSASGYRKESRHTPSNRTMQASSVCFSGYPDPLRIEVQHIAHHSIILPYFRSEWKLKAQCSPGDVLKIYQVESSACCVIEIVVHVLLFSFVIASRFELFNLTAFIPIAAFCIATYHHITT